MKTRLTATTLACLVAGTAWGQTISTLEVGAYSAHEVTGPWCGMMSNEGQVIGWYDWLDVFNWDDHYKADMLWFTTGTMQWDFPIDVPSDAYVESVSFTAEISSEVGGAAAVYPSPVAFSFGGVEVGTWTIPGDPTYWSYEPWGFGHQGYNHSPGNSQYGWLATITVDHTGTWLDYQFRAGDESDIWLSHVTLDDLVLEKSLPVGIDVTSGGINIYGNHWGDYDGDLSVVVEWSTLATACGDESDYQSHGQYVSCVVHYAQDLRDAGVIDQDEYTALVTEAAHSEVGKK